MKWHSPLAGAILMPLALAFPIDAMAEQYTTVGHGANGFWIQTSADACVTTALFLFVEEATSPGGGTTSFNTAEISYFNVNECTDAYTSWRGYTDVDVAFSPNPGLSQARLSATVPVFGEHCGDDICSQFSGQVALDVRWSGDGIVEKSSFTDRSSSADGMRFVVPVRTVHAGPNPKYFGTGRGVTWYNLISDQFSGLNAITVPGTLRDSLVLLAVVLEQQTELQPTQIMTDTGAYSDVVFGLFRLLGYHFSPRLADVGGTRFWRTRPDADYGKLNGLARQSVKLDLIAEHWDDLLRLAALLQKS